MERINVPVSVTGLSVTLPSGLIEKELECVSFDYVHIRGQGKKGRYQRTVNKLYKKNRNGTISCGLGAILFLAKNNKKYRFVFDKLQPPRKHLSEMRLVPGIVQSPKWTVNGVERWYFHEAMAAALAHHLGMMKLPTGAGKTEIILTIAVNQLREFGTGLILVSSLNIKDQFIDRAKSYGIDLVEYSSNRKKEDLIGSNAGVILITTPIVFFNDLAANKNIFKDELRFILSDESHHAGSMTWLNILRGCPNLTRSHGFSATPVDYETPQYTSFEKMPLMDATGIANVGSIIYEKSAEELREFLNLPLLINVYFRWKNNVYDDQNGNDPTKYMDAVHSYQDRIEFIKQIHKLLLENNYNSIHHVFRKDYGINIRDSLEDSRVVTWYGGGKVQQSLTNDTMDRTTLRQEFGNSISDIIATSHAIEGLDLPCPIDAVLLSEGKGEKASVQKVGRGIRPSDRKSIVINVNDDNCAIAKSQSRKRSRAISNEFGCNPIELFDLNQLYDLLVRINQ